MALLVCDIREEWHGVETDAGVIPMGGVLLGGDFEAFDAGHCGAEGFGVFEDGGV